MRIAAALFACAACGAPGSHHVAIRDFAYGPEALHVEIGDTVTWTNRDIVPHTVTFAGVDRPDSVAAGMTWHLVVPAGDTLRYWCRYHPAMTGVLVVD